MLWKKIKQFGKISFIVIYGMLLVSLAGCSKNTVTEPAKTKEQSNVQKTGQGEEMDANTAEAEKIIAIYQGIYEETNEEDRQENLQMIRNIVNQLGEEGYTAIDSKNQINMTKNEQMLQFCEQVDAMEEGKITVVEVTWTDGCVIWNLQTKEGKVDVIRSYYGYKNGNMEKTAEGDYQTERWEYTEEGYIMFSGSWFSEQLYALTMSSAEENITFRVLPLDEKYRELGRKYLAPVGFERNNMFIVDWDEEDFGELNFYDMYDVFYSKVNTEPNPYVPDENLGIGAVYRIPQVEFEQVIQTYFNIDSETLQSKISYHPEDATYEYKPRGFFEIEYPEHPYSEVVGVTENNDGTITLTANVVFPYAGKSKVYAHEVVVRPLADDGVQYVSNRVIPAEENSDVIWYTSRLTEAQWNERYGGQ